MPFAPLRPGYFVGASDSQRMGVDIDKVTDEANGRTKETARDLIDDDCLRREVKDEDEERAPASPECRRRHPRLGPAQADRGARRAVGAPLYSYSNQATAATITNSETSETPS
jgi:hypothetical protein